MILSLSPRHLTREDCQVPVQELPECDALLGAVQIGVISICKVHGNIQRKLCVALKPKVIVPHKRQNATPVCVHMFPDMAPPT